MKIIGITGGVGSGKSRVLSYMETKYRAVICQADQVAWKLQEPGTKCYREIVGHYGEEILNDDQTIDRKKLGQIVFADEKELKILNQIMHPAVKEQIKKLIQIEKEKGTTLFLLEAALLLEEKYDEICDELWFVYANEAVRRMRLKESRNYSDEKISAIIETQLSEKYFQEHCQIMIDNSGEFEDTCIQIENAMKDLGVTI